MTVYGGPRSTPPGPEPDPVLLGALGFLVVAIVVGVVFGVQAFTSDSPQGTGNNALPQTSAPPATTQSSAAAPPSPSASPTPSPTPSRPPALVQAKPSLLRASHSGLCMQANEGNGASAVQQPCDGNNPTELWVPQAANGSQDTFMFVNAKANLCLDVNGGSKDNGAQIVQWACHNGPNQLWRLQPDGDGFRFLSVNSGRCIGVDAGSPNPGAAARQWDCDGSPNQRWQIPQ